jgi:toluene monooxygenase system protein E
VTGRRTFWHLEGLQRKPSDYEVATTGLLYHRGQGLEVETRASRASERALGSLAGWPGDDHFRDPRATTYAGYTALQAASETHIDHLLRGIDDGGYDRRLPAAWVDRLEAILPPLRYPVHGLQMIAAYLGHWAPSGRIVVCCLFQAADEVRRIQRLAYRMRQLQDLRPGFGDDALQRWREAREWQGLRRVIEQLLVTQDWVEVLAALTVALKPAFDGLFVGQLAEVASAQGDPVLGQVLAALGADGAWHRAWSQALWRALSDSGAVAPRALEGCLARWQPRVIAAMEAVAPLLGAGVEARGTGGAGGGR